MARFEMGALEASEIATAGGTPDALFELGLMYCAGREVELDLVSAHKWFNLAAMRGNHDAKRYRMEIALRDVEGADRRCAAAGARVDVAALRRLENRRRPGLCARGPSRPA